jgi:hypothetical protein
MKPLQAATGEVQFIEDLVSFGAKCTVLVSHKYGKDKRKDPWRERALAGVSLEKMRKSRATKYTFQASLKW